MGDPQSDNANLTTFFQNVTYFYFELMGVMRDVNYEYCY